MPQVVPEVVPQVVPEVVVTWTAGDAVATAQQLAAGLLGRHPGPLHHACPTCGSIEHGRPYFDAAVAVSVAHAGGLHLVAVSTAGQVGVDLERSGAADAAWVRHEALGKAHGTGIVAPPGEGTAFVLDLDIPGHVAALVVLTDVVPSVSLRPGGPAAPSPPATR
ncbi:hypothetical protein [Marmoricola sp. RAF53]|uniref:hypothetical protein n=1 Tax=Marmoricola sp. RAF53 TaxID=3233059 RepID=UPI003F9B954B